MKPAMKAVLALAPTSTTNGATQTANIDTLGFDFVSLDVGATTADVVSNKFQTLKISESDTTDATNFADVTKLVAGGVGGFTLPNANTSAAYLTKFNIDVRARKRYLKVSVSPRTTQTLWATANLMRGEVSPTDATGAGVNALIEA